jgi:hypothetical protein
MGRGIQGDPSAAMLEVLDPEQNSTFRDNYLGVPFDLSRVVFLTTANMLDTVPGPLLDRMEIISLAGYTEDEKLEIARRYLARRQLEANGLKADQAEIVSDALRLIIRGYTREAGVRNLEREIGKAFRHVAVQIAEGSSKRVVLTPKDLTAILGPPRFENEIAMRTSVPGVATGAYPSMTCAARKAGRASDEPSTAYSVLIGSSKSFSWKPIENFDHLPIAHLTEISIKVTDCSKNFRHFETYQVVNLPAQLADRVGRSYGNGEHQFFRFPFPDRLQCGAHRRACRNAIINHDDDLSRNLRPGASSDVELPPTFDFHQFRCTGFLKFARRYTREFNHFVIANDDWRDAVHHRSHRKLGLGRYTDFANKNEIEGSVECLRNFRCNRNTAARQGENNSVGVPVFRECFGQSTPGIRSIAEYHYLFIPWNERPGLRSVRF